MATSSLVSLPLALAPVARTVARITPALTSASVTEYVPEHVTLVSTSISAMGDGGEHLSRTGELETVTLTRRTSPRLATVAANCSDWPAFRNVSGVEVIDTLREGFSGDVLETSTAPVLAIRAPLALLPVARTNPRIAPADMSAFVTS